MTAKLKYLPGRCERDTREGGRNWPTGLLESCPPVEPPRDACCRFLPISPQICSQGRRCAGKCIARMLCCCGSSHGAGPSKCRDGADQKLIFGVSGLVFWTNVATLYNGRAALDAREAGEMAQCGRSRLKAADEWPVQGNVALSQAVSHRSEQRAPLFFNLLGSLCLVAFLAMRYGQQLFSLFDTRFHCSSCRVLPTATVVDIGGDADLGLRIGTACRRESPLVRDLPGYALITGTVVIRSLRRPRSMGQLVWGVELCSTLTSLVLHMMRLRSSWVGDSVAVSLYWKWMINSKTAARREVCHGRNASLQSTEKPREDN